MERMQLVQTDTSDLALLSDSEIEAFFAGFGIDAVAVDRCDEDSCGVCGTDDAALAA